MRLIDLNPVFYHSPPKALHFLCPCCQLERIVVTFQDMPYAEQKEMMSKDFTEKRDLWVPAPSFTHHEGNHLSNPERITVRPSIDVSSLGHGAWFISNGEVEKKNEED